MAKNKLFLMARVKKDDLELKIDVENISKDEVFLAMALLLDAIFEKNKEIEDKNEYELFKDFIEVYADVLVTKKMLSNSDLKEFLKRIEMEMIAGETQNWIYSWRFKNGITKKIAPLGGYSVFLIVQDGLTYYSYKGEYIVGKLIIGAGFNFKVDNEDIFIWNYNFYHDNRKFLFEIRKIQDLTTAIRKELYAFQYINPKGKEIIHRLKEIF